jgi:uncharacterized protein involved in exopolysaccharide biosynthesis
MLKGLTTRLASTAADMEKEIVDNRQQKQEAMDYRVTKAQEVTEIEKALATDIHALTKRKDELEAELNEVKGLLAAATSRHINIQEEKEQFDEASSNIVAQLSIRVCPLYPLCLACILHSHTGEDGMVVLRT